jgi:1-phosphofructokinase family hexose kinase
MTEPARPALLCITPSPAVDRTARVERIAHHEVLRPLELHALAGGKGVNAARAAVALGGRVITTGIAGGHAGRWLVETLSAEGLEPHWSFAKAETRTTYVVVDGDGDSILVYERPSAATPDEYAAFLRLLEERLLPTSGRAVVAGSIPAGLDPAGHGAIVEACREAGVPLLVDTAGHGLEAALAARADVVKVGRVEAVETGVVRPEATAVEAAAALADRGAALAVVTDGADEVAAANETTVWQLSVPRIQAVNAVGSGDAFDAAMSLALLDGADLPTALVKGVAAGSANALTISAASLDPKVAAALEADVTVTTSER